MDKTGHAKEWTREEIDDLLNTFAMQDGPWSDNAAEKIHAIATDLNQTRLDLETAKESSQEMRESQFAMNCEITRLRGALERIASNGSMEENARMMQQIAREALKEKP